VLTTNVCSTSAAVADDGTAVAAKNKTVKTATTLAAAVMRLRLLIVATI
jgi:hypothetical protein